MTSDKFSAAHDVSNKRMGNKPSFQIEMECTEGDPKRPVCGVDEAGRGPLAGPVVVAAVILDPDNIPQSINDSKKLSSLQREAVYEAVMTSARAVSIVSLAHKTIDQINIRAATLKGMENAVRGLNIPPWIALVDGNSRPDNLPCRVLPVVRGDQKSLSIAAASIIAKVARDNMMKLAHKIEPEYGFSSHKGYGTEEHRAKIREHGPGRFHRRSFAPVKHLI